MKIIVGVADLRVTNDPAAILVTYALGSCIGVVVYDPKVKVGGLLHYMLPDSSLDPDKAGKNPFMFADTGILHLFREVYKLGAEKGRMTVKIAGGSQLLDDSSQFNIGKRNYAALRKIFWNHGVLIQGEAIGGNTNRTVRLDLSSGRVWVKTAGYGEKQL
jgi:chemotaxis protein CheD